MAINKVEFGGETLIDLTGDSVTEQNLLEGATAHNAAGEQIVGKVVVADIIDNLESERTDAALSAKQGNELNKRIEDIKLFKFPNAVIHGEPTVTAGQISDFSNQSYLVFPFVFDFRGKAFEISVAFTTKSDVTTAQNLLGSNYCIAVYILNRKLVFRVSSNGTSWNAVDYTTNVTINPNTTYYFKFTFNRLNYKISYSTDGDEYTQDGYVTTTLEPNPREVYIGVGNGFVNPFLGIINFNRFEIRINNLVYWEGMDDVGLATRMATDMENIDEAGIEKVKSIVSESAPSFEESERLENIESGETIPTVFGKVRKLFSHLFSFGVITDDEGEDTSDIGRDADTLGGRIRPSDIDEIREDVTLLNSNLSELETSFSLVNLFALGTSIASGYDLNTIKESGVYYSGSGTRTQSLINRPSQVNTGFKMIVFPTSGNEYVKQTIFPSTVNTIYVRTFTGSGWTSWDRIIPTS